MGKRGPGSSKISVVEPRNIKKPDPLVGMTAPARTVWKRIVGVFPGDHFKPHHYDLLRMYCEAAAINKISLEKAHEDGYENPHWINVAEKMAARCTALSLKLGISLNSAMVARRKEYVGSAPEQKNKWDGLLYGAGKK